MDFTVKEIYNLAQFAGLIMDKNHLPTDDEFETEISIIESDDKKYAYFSEYPDEGSFELGFDETS